MPRTSTTAIKTSTRRAKPRKKNAGRAAAVASAAVVTLPRQPIHLPKFTPGRDYQVANPRLINGRLYKAGEILDQTGIAAEHVETLRELRIIVDIVGDVAPLPIPSVEPAPISPEERQAMREGDAIGGKAVGKVFPKYTGFSTWHVVDQRGTKVSKAFGGNTPRVDAQREANRLNREAGIEVTDEDELRASRQDDDQDEG